MVFIHVYHSKAWLVDDYRDPALETNITTTVTGAASRDPLFEPDPKIRSRVIRCIGFYWYEFRPTMALLSFFIWCTLLDSFPSTFSRFTSDSPYLSYRLHSKSSCITSFSLVSSLFCRTSCVRGISRIITIKKMNDSQLSIIRHHWDQTMLADNRTRR